MAFKRDVHIEAPAELVFRVLTTYEYAPKVLNHIEDVEVIGEHIEVGTKIKEKRNINKTLVENTLEVTEYKPNKKFATHSEQNGIDLIYEYTLSEVEGGTDINFEGKIKPKGLRNKLYKPLIGMLIKKEDGDHLQQLREYIKRNYNDEMTRD
ncbi:hypothetical protein E3U55_10735 [Filobacillus milosensis]|uniref:DUF3284 domain-containing protein n=1 Tax=Filobacillus milosensis TaxID=94137 RepID=A0A4Y8IIW0_9BACI|nr:SRPBCC family protein [Filobacillus milosensis]TFB19622.1 hypothetical protein E3U55_10735 [Filobacillus milosensis]